MILPTKIQCIIFDMDGVIIDSEEIHKKAYFETFDAVGVKVNDDLYKTFTGSSTLNAFQKLVAYFQLDINPQELLLDKRKRYVNYFENDPTLHLVSGVEDLIKKAHQKGLTLILASSSAMENIERVFNRFQLQEYFTAKISGADLKASKPHPEIFEKAVMMSGVSIQNCVVIEDSDNGIEAANSAGIFVFGYKNPLAADQTLEKADLIIDDLREVENYI